MVYLWWLERTKPTLSIILSINFPFELKDCQKYLSFGGKDVFSKVVLQSFPSYTFSVFLKPRVITDAMIVKMRRFWWESKRREHAWAMLKWDMVCFPKGMGDLGFKDLCLFNLALLGHQVWRLINNRDTLCYKVFSFKYFPDGNLFHLKRVDKPLFAWTSLTIAIEELEDGFGWQIGNGQTRDRASTFCTDYHVQNFSSVVMLPKPIR